MPVEVMARRLALSSSVPSLNSAQKRYFAIAPSIRIFIQIKQPSAFQSCLQAVTPQIKATSPRAQFHRVYRQLNLQMDKIRAHNLDQSSRLKQDTQSDHSQGVPKLQGGDNQIAKKGDTVISAAPMDILDIFPPEIWIHIVKHALPVHGYSFALLLLTMVSTNWMQALTSVPTLWAYIDVRGSQEDSLATIEAFRRLSCDVPLHLTVHVPTGYDQSTIRMILTSIGGRIHEVTITRYTQTGVTNEETGVVLQLLLTGSKFNSILTYINLPDGLTVPPDTPPLTSTRLPPSLCGIRCSNLNWWAVRNEREYLERLEDIEVYARIESVLSRRIQLPALRRLHVWGYVPPSVEFKPEDEEGFPPLHKLTSLTCNCPYHEVVIQLLISVATQLVYLNLRVPYTKIPLLCAGLRDTINLRNLTVFLWEYEGDKGINGLDVCPVYRPEGGKNYGLRDFTLLVRDDDQLFSTQPERRGPFLSYFVSTVSALYTKVETMRIQMVKKHPIASELLLSYMASLTGLRRLHLQGTDGYFPETKKIYTMSGLEYLDIMEMDPSRFLSTPNILSLSFSWGFYRQLDSVRYIDLQKLVVSDRGAGPLLVELPESSFPSLKELTLIFRGVADAGTYSPFKLPSFKFLRSITVHSAGYRPQGTMLCFALLNHPSTCPSLNEIRFTWHFPDWDILFIMLEKRNFMVDSAVSLIRRITLPFIPNELWIPLASLLRGVNARRPSNKELFMGGARELLLDEEVLGCIDCLMLRMVHCNYPVGGAREGSDLHQDNQDVSPGVEYAWTEKAECGDPAIVDWTVKRQLLLKEFLAKVATWTVRHHRQPFCSRRDTGMEITEHGVIGIVAGHPFAQTAG